MKRLQSQYGYNLIISQSQESGKKEISSITTLFNSRVDGLLVSLSYETKNLDPFNIFFRKGIPVVFFDRVFNCPGCISIVINNYRAGYEATSHLISQGCKRIVHLGGSLLLNVYADRFGGYKQALKDNGLKFDQDLVISSALDEKAGIEAARRIMRMDKRPVTKQLLLSMLKYMNSASFNPQTEVEIETIRNLMK